MPLPNEFSARIKEPGDFKEGSFRRKNIAPGINFIQGKLKDGSGKMEVQAIIFDSNIFADASAKKWLEDNKYKPIDFKSSDSSKKTEGNMPDKKPKELEIEVFKTGSITDSAGDTKEWTLEDLKTIASTYNDTIKEDPGAEAPVVKGHPETDDPAYGWVEKLRVAGQKLLAKIKIVPTFAEEVKDEMFKKVSIALYPDLMLRHIGFLGAAQPAVKGLEPVKFNDNDRQFKEMEFEDIPANPSADPVEEVKKLAEERAKKYGIGVKDKIGYISKPDAYKDLEESIFADPVNYLYPLNDKANWYASFKTFSPWEHNYTDVEKQVILAKFYQSALDLGIDFEPDKIYFNEKNDKSKKHVDVPVEQLTKTQMKNIINQKTNQNNKNNFQTNLKGKAMFKEWYDAFVQAITTKLSENASEEVATQFQSFADEYVSANPMPADVKAAEGGTEHTEPTEKEKEFAEQIAQLQKKNRQLEFNEYYDGLVKEGKVVPAQKELIMNVLEMVQGKDGFEFTENGKTEKITAEVAVKKVIASFPKQVEFNELAKDGQGEVRKSTIDMPDNVVINEESLKLDEKIMAYIESERKEGRTITYEQAASKVHKL